jgi:hypothetical protein
MHSDPLFIATSVNNVPNLTFVRANTALITQHQASFDILQTDTEKEKLLISLWESEYQAQLIKQSNVFVGVKFHNNTALSMFLLQWS